MTALKITAALFGWFALAAVLAPVVGRKLRGRDDLMALVDATAEPTPIYDETARHMARIDALCAEWAVEVEALADLELAEMTGEES